MSPVAEVVIQRKTWAIALGKAGMDQGVFRKQQELHTDEVAVTLLGTWQTDDLWGYRLKSSLGMYRVNCFQYSAWPEFFLKVTCVLYQRQWTFRLLSCFGCRKQCCNEHWGAYICGYMPRNGIPGPYGSSTVSFLRTLYTAPHSDHTSLHSHQQWGLPCLHILSSVYCCGVFDDG